MPFTGKELFWHLTMIEPKLTPGAMGLWVTTLTGQRELVDQRCIGAKPREPAEEPCGRCGYKLNAIKAEDAHDAR